MSIQIISAGAGSGKTYRLTQDMVRYLHPDSPEKVRASGIFATTFTNKAAAELQDRVRLALLEQGLAAEADALTGAMIGTVHSLGVKLLRRFAFEAGVSPQVDILPEEDSRMLFNQSLAQILSPAQIHTVNQLAERLAFYKSSLAQKDWRTEVQNICDTARANNFSLAQLRESCEKVYCQLSQPPARTIGANARSLSYRIASVSGAHPCRLRGKRR